MFSKTIIPTHGICMLTFLPTTVILNAEDKRFKCFDMDESNRNQCTVGSKTWKRYVREPMGIETAVSRKVVTPPSPTPPPVLRGDVNADGSIDLLDVTVLKRYLLRK